MSHVDLFAISDRGEDFASGELEAGGEDDVAESPLRFLAAPGLDARSNNVRLVALAGFSACTTFFGVTGSAASAAPCFSSQKHE